jgi:hypothetical protein
MLLDTEALIVQTIENLRTISAMLVEDLSDARGASSILNKAGRQSEEIVAVIDALLPKLQAAQFTQPAKFGNSHHYYGMAAARECRGQP